jgi:hypothetical protein
MRLCFPSLLTTFAIAASVAVTASLHAQGTIPIRELAPPDANAVDHFGLILGLRPLPNGKLLIDDGGNRQLSVVDERLANRTIVLDSVSASGQSYGLRAAPIIRYLGDSTLMPDNASRSLLVLSSDGKPVRVTSAPKADDIYSISASASGTDATGQLVYLGREPMINSRTRAVKGNISPPDSAPIVRANFETRAVDTIARVKLMTATRGETVTEGDKYVTTLYINPLSSMDEWAVLSDGTVAVVRGQDYHVDLTRTDGTKISGPKLAFDWKKLSDADKQHLIDSTHIQNAKHDSIVNALPDHATLAQLQNAGGTISLTALEAARTGGRTKDDSRVLITTEVAASELPDYWPPIRTGAALADYDANLWILPTTSAQSRKGELVYDVVNNRGVMMYRVRIPLGKTIAGFGPHGVVYLMAKGADGWTLERTRTLGK